MRSAAVGLGLNPARLFSPARALSAVPWLILAFGPIWMAAVSSSAPDLAQSVLTVSLGVFFLALLARLALAAVSQPARRGSLILLLVAVLLWAAGSALLNGSGQPDLTTFPTPGEWLFLAAYAGMAGYLILDAGRRMGAAGATWLETAVICGGSACLAGDVLITQSVNAVGRDGLSLLLALLYPLIDIVLFLLVVAQVALHTRASVRDAGGLLVGFILFAVADAGFLVNLSAGTYEYSIVSVDLWGAGFALIVGNACRVREPAAIKPSGRGLTWLVVAASMAAGFVLALAPNGTVRSYLVVPALATLAAAGARLALALRAANRAADAIALSRSDDLTDLPNRRALLAVLDEQLATADTFGLMILDLDGFKDVNDTLGHAAGDTVLREVAARMRGALPASIMIARLGGDEFALVAQNGDEIELMEVAAHVLSAVRAPMQVDGIALSTDASIGITVRSPADGLNGELLRRADVAMYDAKRKRAGALLYDAHSDDFSRDRLRLSEELRRGIIGEQLVVWYQPQLDAATGRVCGLEALVRWEHPTRGLLNPALFLPVARRAGLMQSMSDEIGRLTVADMARWELRGLIPRVAINCAPPELMSGIFIPMLDRRLRDASVSPARVTIEVTEDSFLSEPERARELLLDVRRRGFQVSIDDYGTGFSSLSYLRDLPVQELKMDRSFVATMQTDARSRMIVASTFQMAAALGLRTVAEGVENAETAAALIAMDVDVLQGYHISRPMPAAEVEVWLRQMQDLLT